jgi:hypothetical protein
MATLLLFIIVAVVLGIIGAVVEGLGYLLAIGVVIFVAAIAVAVVGQSRGRGRGQGRRRRVR